MCLVWDFPTISRSHPQAEPRKVLCGVETVLERFCVHPVVINLFSNSICQSLPEAAVGMWVCDTGRMLLPTGLACMSRGHWLVQAPASR